MSNEKQKIMMVDDRPENLIALEAILEEDDRELVKANSGEEALKFLLRDRFSLVLLDVQMPGMDGFEAHRMLRDDPDTKHIPVIACTAYRDDQVDQRIENEAFDGFVEKPLKLDQLLDMIKVKLQLPAS